jgi:pantoate--beta-alanine ligase
MDTVTTIADVRDRVLGWRKQGQRIALVPTMGNLHRGHLSLIVAARRQCERCVTSLFVNPTQFGPSEDFARYPRTPEQDQRLLADAGCDLAFMPEVGQMYPGGLEQVTRVEVSGLSGVLEGAFRPGHFAGVATVVTKLLNIVQPDVAVFGEKDFQQLTIIRRLVVDLCLPVEIIGAPIVRDPDGLALSSRNQYLSAEERAVAPQLHAALARAAARLAAGEQDFADIERAGQRSSSATVFFLTTSRSATPWTSVPRATPHDAS